MSVWNVFHKDGSLLRDDNGKAIAVHELEYNDSWMGECYLTVSFKNEAPIKFSIGDYIEYRGERFELNYDPGKNKQARKNTYGEGFVYESVKFNSLQDELTRTEFLDVVLNDNLLHYTALPKFSFYVETLDDLLDRIQANLDEQIGKGIWRIYSRSLERSTQRGCTEEGWENIYGKGTSAPAIIDSKPISIDTKNCWEALSLVNSEWDINFIVRGRDICVETIGIPTKNIFKYGIGNGLYEVDQNADSSQQIITRLRAYGSEKNLPSFYYADLGTKYFTNIAYVRPNVSAYILGLDLTFDEKYFKVPIKASSGSGFVVEVTFDFITYVNCIISKATSAECVLIIRHGNDKDNGEEPSVENIEKFKAQVGIGEKVHFASGVNTKTLPVGNKEYAENLPNNMACNRLMLPGFPHMSLQEYYDNLSAADKQYVNPSGKKHVFSTDKYRPYIDSVNIEMIGLRSASQFFDQDDKNNGVIEIYPTIEEMEVNGERVDAIYTGSNIEDDGRFEDGVDVNNFDIFLNPNIDFNINDLRESDFAINMKDGMCGGRTFQVASADKVDGVWRLTLQRVKDEALELWFPYNDYQIKAGDHFVLTGITMPAQYVRAASLKLLKYAIAFIDKNDYTRYVYQPKVDEIYMARQHDEAVADKTGTIVSLHDTLKAGDLMQFEDNDFAIKAAITIDQLTISEKEGEIPTYEVTLREDKEVGTIQKIQNQINSLVSSNGANTTATMNQLRNLIPQEGAKYFASKLYKDKVQDELTFDKLQKFLSGLEVGNYQSGAQGGFIDSQGNAELLSIIVRKLISSANYKSGFDGEGYRLWIDEEGLSNLELDRLTVRQIMTVFELIIDRIRAVGGQIVVSAANGKIKAVEDTGEAYKITFEGDNYFQAHDLMRCQVFNGEEIRGYWVEVTESYADYIVVAKSEFSGTITVGDKNLIITEPKEGDEVVLMGNTVNVKRQNLISISATEDGEPRIDVLDGVKAKNFNGALRARLGNLDGITDTSFPLNAQPHGNGLYADNVYLRGSFLLSTGEDIRTKFDVMEGKISSSVDAVRKEFMEDKGYFNNPTFGEGMSHWTAENATTFFFLGNKWIWANNNVLAKKGDGASLATDDGRTVVRIKNKYICQKYSDLRAVPEIKTNEDGKKEPTPVYLSFYYKVKTKGTLTIGFEDINNDGFIDYEPLSYSQELDVTETYQQLTISGLWNATGDFKLSFTGEMFVHMFVLSTDRIESLTYTYRTLFEQSEKLVRIAAMNFDKDGNVLESSEIITTAKYNELISQRFDENGNLKNTAGLITTTDWETWQKQYAEDLDGKMGKTDMEAFSAMFVKAVDEEGLVKRADISAFVTKDENGWLESGVFIGADNIKLEGVTTINEKFRVLGDGSIEAVDATLSGNFTSADEKKNNSIILNAEEGYMKMTGPTYVRDDNHDLPAIIGGEDMDLWKVQFETDPDTLSRVATMYIYGRGTTLRLDPLEGISLDGVDNDYKTRISMGKITLTGLDGQATLSSGGFSVANESGSCQILPGSITFYNNSGKILKEIKA